MRDIGHVIQIKDGTAEVEISSPGSHCEHCSAKSICLSSSSGDKKILTVQNPVNAQVGDRVEIEIPEAKYQSTLIFIFGSLLLAILIGSAFGYGFSILVSLSPALTTFVSLLIFLTFAAFWVKIKLKKKNQAFLWPIIVNIVAKGETNG